jgi:hypothetical protein
MRLVATMFLMVLVVSGISAQRKPGARPSPTPKREISVQTAVTKDGRTVLLKSDGTWEYTDDPILPPQTDVRAKAGVSTALKALRLMAGATDVGINFQEYGRRMIDAKADVEGSLSGIPESELRSEIEASLLAYVDAGRAWNELIRRGRPINNSSLFPDSDPFADTIQKRYSIPTETIDPSAVMSPEVVRVTRPENRKAFRSMSGTVVLNTIWSAARKHLEKAESLSSK